VLHHWVGFHGGYEVCHCPLSYVRVAEGEAGAVGGSEMLEERVGELGTDALLGIADILEDAGVVTLAGYEGTTDGELLGVVACVDVGIVVEFESIVDCAEPETALVTSTVTVEGLKLIVEYAVAVIVARDGVTEKITVLVVSDDLVTGGSVSVLMTVVVAGAGTSVTVSTMVTAGRPPFPVAGDPPSTGTTEYVALLLTAAGCAGERGNEAVKKNSEVKAQSAEVEN
jgi:hypothetical protein